MPESSAAAAVSLRHEDSTTTTTTDGEGNFEFQVSTAGLYEVVREARRLPAGQ